MCALGAAVRAGHTAARAVAAKATDEEEDEEAEAQRLLEAAWSPQQRIAETLVRGMRMQWEPAMSTLAKAGRAFDGLEALLGGGAFDLQVCVSRMCTCHVILPCEIAPSLSARDGLAAVL